ncbi:rhamnose-binding lectin-like [Salminus brasiliensis]|uniref:rhamnose-binding lectin-like n=1 Tax=Salminus brasiliensis TaxID=930266 RepID=UPI003B839560
MFILKLSLLTVLFAAQGLLISAENAITCYGNVQRLSCDSGLISVKSAIYGRTDSTTCSAGRPPVQVQNTQCSLKISLISKRCNGQRVCEFKTDVLGSPDPCVGTYKYYNTTYDCIQGRVRVLCEDSYGTLDCGNEVIQIINANYGRTDGTTCSEGLPGSLIGNTNCYAPDTLTSVATVCNGRSSCPVQASYTIFTDPCVGISKYLTVSYFCLPPSVQISVTCEGSTAVLTCGTGVLQIQSANYGRTDSIICSAGRPVNQVTKTDCYASNTLAIVMNRCHGKTTCSVSASNDVFSDPCVNTYKYLSIAYSCAVY